MYADLQLSPVSGEDVTDLDAAQIERLGTELDDLYLDVQRSLGHDDARYIRRTIAAQRALDFASRCVITATRSRAGWLLGTAGLTLAKVIENMEIAHNVTHGQWDWMNDPEIHSTTWEWDMVGVSHFWRRSHNYLHHRNTNVVGVDDDLGFGVMHVTDERPWRPVDLAQPARAVLLALLFEWGIALQSYYAARDAAPTPELRAEVKRRMLRKIRSQCLKDYVLHPALSGRRWRRTLGATATANVVRNVWAYTVIMCGHIPTDAARFDPSVLDTETRGEWYVRQMAGSSDFRAGRILAFLSGHLSHQIEHHLFPALPSRRLPETKRSVARIFDAYGLPYPTHSFAYQIFDAHRAVVRMALPLRRA